MAQALARVLSAGDVTRRVTLDQRQVDPESAHCFIGSIVEPHCCLFDARRFELQRDTTSYLQRRVHGFVGLFLIRPNEFDAPVHDHLRCVDAPRPLHVRVVALTQRKSRIAEGIAPPQVVPVVDVER